MECAFPDMSQGRIRFNLHGVHGSGCCLVADELRRKGLLPVEEIRFDVNFP